MTQTLEESAKIFVNNRFSKQISGDNTYPDIYASKESIIESHILFAKWQQEQSKEMEKEQSNDKIQKAIELFEEAKRQADIAKDVIYLDGVLAVLDGIKNTN